MCIPKDNRTLQSEYHDLIYDFFEEHDLCKKYVQDPDFRFYMNTQRENKIKPDSSDRIKFGKFIVGIQEFIEIDDVWRVEICNFSRGDFFKLMENNHIFDILDSTTEPHEKINISYSQFCYHLGMITLDYIDSTNST